ncbi:MAG TPA: MarR family transcriptional regulator [Solirubrobacteraceae bacterium]|nr:MarR family transcriptional regulator [Solirubrobacteraceae bacterium]
MSEISASNTDDRSERLEYVSEHLLSRAAVLVRLLVRQVRSDEISRTEMGVLGILAEGPRRITELSELEGVAQPTMTLLVKRLQEKGWVVRDGLPDDGRVVIVSLTAQGRSAQQRLRAQFLAALRADLDGLSDRELQRLAVATRTLGSFVDQLQRRSDR